MALLSAVTYFTARTIWTGAVQCVDLVWLAVSVHHFSLVLCLSIFHSLTESLCPSSLWGKYDVQEADCNGAEGFFLLHYTAACCCIVDSGCQARPAL